MDTAQPDHTDPIPLRNTHGLGVITVRFLGLLALAVVVLALIWNR